jgi:hypothetical protein
MESSQKQYSILLGGFTNIDDSTWLNKVQRDEAGKIAAWLPEEQVIC